jgi:hypothetical protein
MVVSKAGTRPGRYANKQTLKRLGNTGKWGAHASFGADASITTKSHWLSKQAKRSPIFPAGKSSTKRRRRSNACGGIRVRARVMRRGALV